MSKRGELDSENREVVGQLNDCQWCVCRITKKKAGILDSRKRISRLRSTIKHNLQYTEYTE